MASKDPTMSGEARLLIVRPTSAIAPKTNFAESMDSCIFSQSKQDEAVVTKLLASLIATIEKKEPKIPSMMKSCSCKMKKCFLKFDELSRRIVHTRFWAQDDYGRRLWLQDHVTLVEPKKRYSEKGERKRLFNRSFLFPNIDKKTSRISVCQVMFLNTLGYKSDEVLRTVSYSIDEAGVVCRSKRGKHAPAHKISFEDDQYIRDHIDKFNPSKFHSSRKHHLYLPSEISVKKMHSDYIDCCKEDNRKAFSEIKYRRVLKDKASSMNES